MQRRHELINAVIGHIRGKTVGACLASAVKKSGGAVCEVGDGNLVAEGFGDLFKNAVDKVGEGIDKALKDEQ